MLSEWSGRTVLLNLWATWCVPCRKEMPALAALEKMRGGDGKRLPGRGHGRDLPAGERRDPCGRFQRRPAGGIGARIAFKPADPVYPRKPGGGPDQDRRREDAEAAADGAASRALGIGIFFHLAAYSRLFIRRQGQDDVSDDT
jgi:hypothetical protein